MKKTQNYSIKWVGKRLFASYLEILKLRGFRGFNGERMTPRVFTDEACPVLESIPNVLPEDMDKFTYQKTLKENITELKLQGFRF